MPRKVFYSPIPKDLSERRFLAFHLCGGDAARLWTLLAKSCDDTARYDADPTLVRNTLFKCVKDDVVTPERVRGLLDELAAWRLITRYLGEDGETYLIVSGYVPSHNGDRVVCRFPEPEMWLESPPSEETFLSPASIFATPGRVPDPRWGQGVFGKQKGRTLRPDKNAPVPPHVPEPVPETRTLKTEPEPEPEPEAKGASPATGERSPKRDSRVAGQTVASDSGSGSDSVEAVGGNGEKIGDNGAGVRLAWGKLCAALVAKNDDDAMQRFADCIVGTLKPGVGTAKDRHDAIALGRKLVQGDGGMELRERMLFAVNEAKSVVETGGGYGAWRNRMSKRFGPWSVKRSAGAGAK